jgi:peptidoglycan/LPS O-acetylase OafA/YrhL
MATLFAFKQKKMPKSVMWFGKISYSFYLTHYYVILIIGQFFDLNKLSLTTIILTMVIFAISLVVAYLAYYLIEVKVGSLLEKSYLKVKKRIVY